jgi:hypothetical protein
LLKVERVERAATEKLVEREAGQLKRKHQLRLRSRASSGAGTCEWSPCHKDAAHKVLARRDVTSIQLTVVLQRAGTRLLRQVEKLIDAVELGVRG